MVGSTLGQHDNDTRPKKAPRTPRAKAKKLRTAIETPSTPTDETTAKKRRVTNLEDASGGSKGGGSEVEDSGDITPGADDSPSPKKRVKSVKPATLTFSASE